MATTSSFPEDPNESPRLEDELIGLDPDDPETRAFRAHLERQHRVRASYTVEGYLSDVGDFADSANRLGGHRKLMAGILVLLILLGVTITAWDALVFVWHTFTN
ncbi:hypothetical protein [Actinophytocola oryzae]|uniref:Uncharacterized protein n=1 Tax=Actinophytocola oryzae TaxID=502181 RepID=A0A4R7VZ24_9PSEU|nr:hypothetical protein [Actinophytocola oryzae]TDV55344.1 hypothetical protein CLV71_103585 [Actinophytocola oryzae]